MIVEFIGSSGSGKSTLIRAVQRQLAKTVHVTTSTALFLRLPGLHHITNPTAQNLIQELGGLPFFLLSLRRYGRFAAYTARMFSRGASLSVDWFRNLRSLERKLAVYEFCSQQSANRIILVDEGPLLAAHAFVFRPAAVTLDEITVFADLAPLPDLVVYVRASVTTLVRRTLQRPDPPREMRCKEPNQTEAYARRTVALFDQLAAARSIRSRLLSVENADGDQHELDRLTDGIATSIVNWPSPNTAEAVALPGTG